MRKIISDNKYFISAFLIFLVIGSIILMLTDKGDVLRWTNQHHTPFTNYFFFYATYFGAELVPVICLIFLFIRIKYFFVLGAANLVASIIVLFLKRMIFSTYPRPSRFFKELGEIVNVVDGVTLHSNFSFPSGHSASGFALFFAIALCIKNKKLGILLFILAFLVGFSRVYLVQHFFMDIFTGGVIACIVTFFVYYYFSTRVWYHEPWANISLIKDWNWKKSRKTPVP